MEKPQIKIQGNGELIKKIKAVVVKMNKEPGYSFSYFIAGINGKFEIRILADNVDHFFALGTRTAEVIGKSIV